MTDKENQKQDQLPAPKLEDLLVMEYESRTFSEIVKEWLPALLPWRKKKRKRD